jgi:hypothetical protein
MSPKWVVAVAALRNQCEEEEEEEEVGCLIICFLGCLVLQYEPKAMRRLTDCVW